MVNLAARRLGQKELTRPKSKEDSLSTGQPVAVSPEMENMNFSNYPYVEKDISMHTDETGKNFNKCYVLSYKERRVGMENVRDIADEGSHPPWPRYFAEFGNLQEYKI